MKYPSLEEYNFLLRKADSKLDGVPDNSALMRHLLNFAVSNPRIRGHINTRRTAVMSWGWEIIGDDYGEVRARLQNVIDLVLASVCDVSLFGKLLIELNPQFDKEVKYQPRKVPQPDFEVGKNGVFYIKGSNGEYMPVDDNFLFVNDNEGAIGGIMRSVGVMEILRNDATFEWANYNRKLKGIIQGIEHGVDDQERAVAAEALQKSLQHNYILTSDLIDFKFHQLTANGAGSSFKDFIEYLNDSISIAILGQANTPDLPDHGGSRAALQVQSSISADIMWSDIQLAENLINNHLLYIDRMLNYGVTGLPPYKFHVLTAETEDYESNIMVVREALASGIPLPKAEVYSKIGFRPPVKDEDLFVGPLG